MNGPIAILCSARHGAPRRSRGRIDGPRKTMDARRIRGRWHGNPRDRCMHRGPAPCTRGNADSIGMRGDMHGTVLGWTAILLSSKRKDGE